MRCKIRSRKKWKDEAVSPVIATILMVAITVVLAAVLYLLVTALIVPTKIKPNVILGSGEPTGNQGEWRVPVNDVDRSLEIASFRIAILNGTAVAIEATSLETIKASGTTGGGLTLDFYEPNSDNNLNAGDYFIVGGTDHESEYVVEVYYLDLGKASGETGKIQQQ